VAILAVDIAGTTDADMADWDLIADFGTIKVLVEVNGCALASLVGVAGAANARVEGPG
jgi:hypothetical protein